MTLKYKINFEEGFHSRPAIELVDLCKKYDDLNIHITKINDTNKEIKCKNLIAILKSNIEKDSIITIDINDSENNDIIKQNLDKIFETGK